MSQWKSSQTRQEQEFYGEGPRSTDSVFTPPTITASRLQPEQGTRTTNPLRYTPPVEVDTERLEYITPPAIASFTRDLKEHRVTKDLRGQNATRVLPNPPSNTQAVSASLVGMMPSTGSARAAVVIPGKRKKGHKQEVQPQRMHPHLRYGLIMGAMLGIIGLALVTLTPLKSDQNQLPVFSNVVRWIQTQQIAWNVQSHVNDQGQVTTTDQTTTTNTTAPITILPTSQYIAIARQAAVNAGISPDYFVNQINAESSFNPNALSPVGAVGIAQFMPSTAAGLGINPYDPVQALNGAARHMANLTRSYGGNYAKALAAYNAGSGTVDYAIQRGGANWMNFVPYETRQYIYKIMGV